MAAMSLDQQFDSVCEVDRVFRALAKIASDTEPLKIRWPIRAAASQWLDVIEVPAPSERFSAIGAAVPLCEPDAVRVGGAVRSFGA